MRLGVDHRGWKRRLAKRVLFCSGGAFTPRCREFVEAMPGRVLDKVLTVAEREAALSRLPRS